MSAMPKDARSGPIFCARCAAPLIDAVPPLDSRIRRMCAVCGFVAYVNPKVAAGTVPVQGGKIALIRRGIEPALGKWSFPCGYVEHDETVEAGAVRETREESGLSVTLDGLLGAYSFAASESDGLLNVTGIVVLAFATSSVSGDLVAGDDATDAAWFDPAAVPDAELAFESTRRALRDQFARMRG